MTSGCFVPIPAGPFVFSPSIGQAIADAYPDARFVAVRGGHRLELDPAYHQAVRVAFFTQGLHAPDTERLIRSGPVNARH